MMRDLKQDIAACEAQLALRPDDIAALNQLAMLKSAAGEHAQALLHITAARALAPNHPLLHYNLGQVHGSAGNYPDEIKAYQHALALKPDFVEAYVNLGVALRDMQQFDEAFEAFKHALRINPDHTGARTNRAQTNLMLGHFEHGWREYEWRWQDGQQQHGITGTRWNGRTSIKGKRLLIHAEQGLGDTLQFARYVDVLKGLGATIILRVQTPLVSLLTHSLDIACIIDASAPLPAFDLHIPLLSLPHVLFNKHPSIPQAHHYLIAQPEKVAAWSKKLPLPKSPQQKLKVGLCWSGSTHHLNDQHRSLQLAQLNSVLALDCTFVSLQKEIRSIDQDTLAAHPNIILAGEEFESFEETAGLLCNLDVVISVDTAVAHLSGALGIPTWILLPEPADWRWMRERTDSPWYPHVKLFRQTTRGEWNTVVQALASELLAHQSLTTL